MSQLRSQASTCDREDSPVVGRFFLACLDEAEGNLDSRWTLFTHLPSVFHGRLSVVSASVS